MYNNIYIYNNNRVIINIVNSLNIKHYVRVKKLCLTRLKY